MRETVLYYAAGGGLGHVSRALAVLSAAALPEGTARVLLTSEYAGLAGGLFPCPADTVPGDAMRSRGAYDSFLDSYLSRGAFRALVMDTFPAGIVGEWARRAARIPRFLVARALKWDAYGARTRGMRFPAPREAFAAEPLDDENLSRLGNDCRITYAPGPVLCRPSGADAVTPPPGGTRCLVVHAGPGEERRALAAEASRRLPGVPCDTVFPADGIFPALSLFPKYTHVVSGAGYNMVGEAAMAPRGRTHVLVPFERRYDDQNARLKRYSEGNWLPRGVDGAPAAGRWLRRALEIN